MQTDDIRYYVGRSDLDRLVADPSVDIHEVVREVERLCDREFHASEYYRENPHLQYAGHPWIKFVASGNAAYLGWDPASPPPSSPPATVSTCRSTPPR